MRLALLIYGPLDTLSGGYLYDRRLVEALRRAGSTVEVLSLPWRSYPAHLADNLSPGLFKRLASLNVDLLLQDELNHPSLFALNPCLRRRVPFPILSIVHHLRSSEAHFAWLNRLYAWVEGRYLNSVDGFVFYSLTTRRVVEARLLRPRPGLVAFPAGNRFQRLPDEVALARRCCQPGPLRLLFIGNVIPRKGLHWVLDELERQPLDTWRLDVVGSLQVEPAYAAAQQRRARRLPAGADVHFWGALSDPALEEQLKTAQVLVVPSAYEGFGIVYLEAMSCGVVPVASTLGAAAEIITPGQNGFLLTPGSPGTLSAVLSQLHQDRRLLLRLSLAARRRFDASPTWEDTTASVAAFLDCFLQGWRSHEFLAP